MRTKLNYQDLETYVKDFNTAQPSLASNKKVLDREISSLQQAMEELSLDGGSISRNSSVQNGRRQSFLSQMHTIGSEAA